MCFAKYTLYMAKTKPDIETAVIAHLKAGIVKREISVLVGVSLATIKRIQSRHGILVDDQVKKQHTSAASLLKWSNNSFRDKVKQQMDMVRSNPEYNKNVSDGVLTKWSTKEYQVQPWRDWADIQPWFWH